MKRSTRFSLIVLLLIVAIFTLGVALGAGVAVSKAKPELSAEVKSYTTWFPLIAAILFFCTHTAMQMWHEAKLEEQPH